MILTDREIQSALHSRQIIIDPPPPPEAYSSTSVDLTLDQRFQFWKAPGPIADGRPPVVSPGVPGFKFTDLRDAYTQTVTLAGGEGYLLAPSQFVLGWTRERVGL